MAHDEDDEFIREFLMLAKFHDASLSSTVEENVYDDLLSIFNKSRFDVLMPNEIFENEKLPTVGGECELDLSENFDLFDLDLNANLLLTPNDENDFNFDDPNLEYLLQETNDNCNELAHLLHNNDNEYISPVANESETRQTQQNDRNDMRDEIFTHILNEKNLRRRSLLFENNNVVKFDPPELNKPKRTGTGIGTGTGGVDALMNHDYTRRRSEEDKYFACPLANCEKIYAKASHLKAHLRRHSGEKPFVCNWINCNWKFSRSDELARHKRSHSGVKPYKCELCDKAFARSDHLSKHNKVHRKKMAQYGTYTIKKRLKNVTS